MAIWSPFSLRDCTYIFLKMLPDSSDEHTRPLKTIESPVEALTPMFVGVLILGQ